MAMVRKVGVAAVMVACGMVLVLHTGLHQPSTATQLNRLKRFLPARWRTKETSEYGDVNGDPNAEEQQQLAGGGSGGIDSALVGAGLAAAQLVQEVPPPPPGQLPSLFSMNKADLTLSNLKAYLNPKKGKKDHVANALTALDNCFQLAALPYKYVVPALRVQEDWSLLYFPLPSAEKDEALQDLAHVVAVVDDLLHNTCPKIVEAEAAMNVRDFKKYALQVLKVAVHKALVETIHDPAEWELDEALVSGLFGVARDVRENPKKLWALNKLLSNKKVYETRTNELAALLESWVTSDLATLVLLNGVRQNAEQLKALRDSLFSGYRNTVFSIVLMGRFTNISNLLEDATQIAWDNLTGGPGLSAEESTGAFRRLNETLLCKDEDETERSLKLPILGRYIYASKYRQVEVEAEENIRGGEFTTFLATVRKGEGADPAAVEKLAKEIELVRPTCYRSEKEAGGEPVVKVHVSVVKGYRKILADWQKEKTRGETWSEKKRATWTTKLRKSVQRISGNHDVLPTTIRKGLIKADVMRFLRNVGLAVLGMVAIGVMLFSLLCIAGFAVTGGGFLTCLAGATLAGSTAFIISPGIAAGLVGFVGLSSTMLWKWRVSSALRTAIKDTIRFHLAGARRVMSPYPLQQ